MYTYEEIKEQLEAAGSMSICINLEDVNYLSQVIITPAGYTPGKFSIDDCTWFWAVHSSGAELSSKYLQKVVDRINNIDEVVTEYRESKKGRESLKKYYDKKQQSGWSEDGKDWNKFCKRYKKVYGYEPTGYVRKIVYTREDD